MAYDLELLSQADREYHGAGAEVENRRRELNAAIAKVDSVLLQRVERYNEAFVGGIVVEKVLDPGKLQFKAGHRADGFDTLDGGAQYADVWMHLDAAHIKKIEGAFAHSAKVDGWDTRRRIADIGMPKVDLELDFAVIGMDLDIHDPDEELIQDQEGVTEYKGELHAIEWRLPSEEEIRAFGGLAAAGAQ